MADTKGKGGRGTRNIVEAQDTGSSTDAQSKSSDGVLANTDNKGSQRGLSWGTNTEWESKQGHTGRSRTAHKQPREKESPVESRMGIHLSDGLSPPLAELDLGIARVAADIPDRAKKLKAIGNAIVPDIPEVIMRIMIDDEES